MCIRNHLYIYLILSFSVFHREKKGKRVKVKNRWNNKKNPERSTLYCLDATKTNWHREKRTCGPNCKETPNKWHSEKHKSGSRAWCDSFLTKHGKNTKIKCYLRFKSPNFPLVENTLYSPHVFKSRTLSLCNPHTVFGNFEPWKDLSVFFFHGIS